MLGRDAAPVIIGSLFVLSLMVRPAGVGVEPQTAPPSERPKTQAPASESDLASGEMWAVLDSYLRTSREQPPRSALQPQVLLVTVPDPSYIAAMFDTFLESIERALEGDGYLLDRFWLPWEDKKETASSGSRELRGLRYERSEPGMLLFRGEEFYKPMIVFLVGETPQAGIQKVAFTRALEYRNLLAHEGPVRVVGPTFSGSVPSLALAVKAALEAQPDLRFELVTGIATSTSNEEQFLSQLGKSYSSRARYRSVLIDDDYAQEQLLRYLESQKIPPNQVAFLAEGGTPFGRGFVSKGEEKKDEREKSDEKPLPLTLPFPMELARLRSSYQEVPDLRALWYGKSQGMPEGSGLETKLKEIPAVTEGVPSFSREQTPLSMELTINNIATAVRRLGIQAVGLTWTDALDTVFVAKLIQKNCPDARLFTFDTDVLYEYSSPSLSFYGMLMVSTYPLVSYNQYWQMPAGDNQLLHFRNQLGEGVYNAFRLQLGEMSGTSRLLEYSHPTIQKAQRPPLWLTAVGRGEAWPVRLLEEGNGEPKTTPVTPLGRGSRPLLPDPPRSWYLLFLFLTGLCGWHLWSLYYLYVRKGRKMDRQASFYLPEARDAESFLYLLVAQTARFGFYLPLALVQFLYLASTASGASAIAWLSGAAGAVVLLGLIAAWAGCWAGLLSHAQERSGKRPEAYIYAGLALLPLVLAWIVAYWSAALLPEPHPGANKVMFALRCLFPASGVSPLLPVAALALAASAWATMQLGRLRLMEVRAPGFPKLAPDPVGIAALAGQTEAAVEHPCKWRELLVAGGALILFAMLLDPWNTFHGLESRWFDLLFLASFLIVCLLTLLTLVRFIRTWFLLRGLLDRLEWDPLKEAFRRLSAKIPELSWQTLWRRGGKKQVYAFLAYALKCLREAAPDKFGSMRKDLNRLRRVETYRLREQKDVLRKVHHELNTCAENAAARVRVCGPAAGKAPELCEDLLALRFAGFIRYITVQLWNLLAFLLAGSIAILIAVNIYPFQPHRTLVVVVSGIVFVAGLSSLAVFAQMDRHKVLSCLGGKKDTGKLSKDFVKWTFTYGTIPLLTMVGSLFPELGRYLFSWLGPSLSALR